ncbi:MAG TPA: hypothetical protein VFV38_10620 [Ktedonobacteraceae bacterium]|nr:hypothetical protein [Ktedonobacteraceae bacterium]
MQTLFSLIAQSRRGQSRHLVSLAQLLQAQVRQVADAFIAVIGVWQVENCLEIKAHIACWHRRICTYRGYVLCSNASERTFLLGTRSWTYVTITRTSLLQIDGVNQAKTFIDTLWNLQKREGNVTEERFEGEGERHESLHRFRKGEASLVSYCCPARSTRYAICFSHSMRK